MLCGKLKKNTTQTIIYTVSQGRAYHLILFFFSHMPRTMYYVGIEQLYADWLNKLKSKI